ncbi:MAG: Gfo/Idh/MocA family oxidoreductase [Eubacteriales bacterium]|nr:Gfo/Idh/MocA family oxidoreductase [Eubacteriales bacterium]
MNVTEKRKTVNIALIGCGFMGKEHSKAWSLAPVSCPDIEATPVKKILCDAFPGAAEEKARLWGYEEYCTDYREILEREDIDIVDICTPAPSHADIAIECIKAGKFVACEKPLVLNRADGERILQAVKKYKGRTATCFNKRRWPAVEFARQLIKEGTIGDIYLYNGRYVQDCLSAIANRGPQSSGGGFADSGSHILDMCRYILDDHFDAVVARTYQLDPDGRKGEVSKRVNEEECFALVLAQMKSGITASLYETYAYSGTGEDISFEVLGSRGSMRWSGANPSVFQLSIKDGDNRTNGFRNILMGPEHPYGNSVPVLPGFGVGVADNMSFQAYEIVNAYCRNYDYNPNFEDAWEIIKVCDDIRTSEKMKQWVKCC